MITRRCAEILLVEEKSVGEGDAAGRGGLVASDQIGRNGDPIRVARLRFC
jgi:hypothetical protein